MKNKIVTRDIEQKICNIIFKGGRKNSGGLKIRDLIWYSAEIDSTTYLDHFNDPDTKKRYIINLNERVKNGAITAIMSITRDPYEIFGKESRALAHKMYDQVLKMRDIAGKDIYNQITFG